MSVPSSMPSTSPVRTYIVKLVFLAAAYAATIYLSLFLVPAGGAGASLVWPPAAVAVAGLFLFGLELWPALLVPFFVLLLFRGIVPPVAASVALGNTLEALFGAYLLWRLDFGPMFGRLQDALVFMLATFLSTLVSSTIIVLALHLFNGTPFDESLWAGLWIGHTVSLLSFGPFVMRWAYKPLFRRTKAEWIESALLFALLAGIFILIFWTHYSSIGSISLFYVAIVPLIWASLRAGPRAISLALMLLGLIGSTGVIFGHAFSAAPNLSQTLFEVQLLVGTLSAIFLLFTSIVEERKDATNALRGHVGQLEVALEKIRQEDQAKTDFIAILAHELRNPLSPLLSNLEIMSINGISEANRAAVHSITSSVQMMARLLDDLLDISRISQKKFKLQRQPVKLGSIVAQSLEMVSPHLAERNHTLTTVLPQEELWVDGDPVRLAQILVNLLGNAAKYTEPGGRVRLEVARRGTETVITVSDSGIGIDPSRFKKVFEPFGTNDAGRGAQGLHIGLSLAKRMAEMHQGSLEAASPGAGRGSIFTLRLPLLLTNPLSMDEEPRPSRSRFSKEAMGQSKQTLGTLCILVVDDNEAAADSLSKLLQHGGHETLVAYDAPEALEICKTKKPDVALLDIGLPTMSGYELGARLREQFGKKIKLAALTGYGQAEDKHKAYDAGFDAHLTKPVSIVDVERALLELGKH